MDTALACPECGALLTAGRTCQDDFHQMLYWENQFPALGAVHHLAVLAYHLQHPSLYSPDGLAYGMQLLVDFLENGLTPAGGRQRGRAQVGSERRAWKVTGRPGAQGAYPRAVAWSQHAGDVVAAGSQSYLATVPAWAASILSDLRAAAILPPAIMPPANLPPARRET